MAPLGSVRFVPAGSFVMGCLPGRDDTGAPCTPMEGPSHPVEVTTPLWVMETELTQRTWESLGFDNPSAFPHPERPVERVTWWDAVAAANAVSQRTGQPACYDLVGCQGQPGVDLACTDWKVRSPTGHPRDCSGWRLPTEAEWERAARAGTDTPFSGGATAEAVARFGGNHGVFSTPDYGTQPACAARHPRNDWGLCDMSGNVWEWTWNAHQPRLDPDDAVDPQGPGEGDGHTARGGGWLGVARAVRISSRTQAPFGRSSGLGFRLVQSAAQ